MTGSDGRPELDLLGIGNAIVDILAHTEDEVLAAEGLPKGSMTLIDAERADALYARMGPGVEVSGGSVANSTVGAASLGSRAAYIGKVHDDEFGRVFAHDIRAAGVHFETPLATGGAPTARCLILVTPDAHRTMSTYLGACVELGPADIDEDLVARAAVTYLEGYLWDPPRAKEAFRVAMAAARRAGRRVALTLSDAFCVERHRDEFRALVDDEVDILFANEAELLSLYQVPDLASAVDAVRGRCEVALVTRSEHGVDGRHRGRGDRGAGPPGDQAGRTPPARATSSPPGSCTASPTGSRTPSRRRSGRSPRPRSSPTSGPAPRPTWPSWRARRSPETPRREAMVGSRGCRSPTRSRT